MPPTISQTRVMQGVSASNLPPSIESAYYRKSIELKRRINEIEESNDVIRTRKARVERAILKLRLERAFLLEQIEKRMEENVEESDRSDSPPPTPQDKPLRTRRTHRKATPPPTAPSTLAPGPPSPSQSYQGTAPQTSPPDHQDTRMAAPYASGPTASSPLNGAGGSQYAGQGPHASPSRSALPPLAPQGGYSGFEGRRENGEERGDAEMRDDGDGFGGGFTAVNR